MVRGPPEGRRRTEGGRSNPGPGYLGNRDRQTGLSVKEQFNFLGNISRRAAHQRAEGGSDSGEFQLSI